MPFLFTLALQGVQNNGTKLIFSVLPLFIEVLQQNIETYLLFMLENNTIPL